MKKPFLAYVLWLASLAFFFWINQGGNALLPVLASLFVLQNVRMRVGSESWRS